MTPEEVAAVTAVAVAMQQREAAAVSAPAAVPSVSAWVDASRRSSQRAVLQRGPWRLSGRMGARSRA